MNEFDFQSGEFLDTLYTGSIYSDDSSITTESSTNPVTTNVGNYGTNVPTAEGSLFDHTRIISTVAVTQGTNSITSSSTDIKSCQSFPPNFYTEISYENDADHEEKSREKASTAVKSELEPSSQTAEPVASSSSPTVQESQAPGIPVAPEPEIEIAINNVVCSFSVRCHLNLRKVATEGMNVIYKRENGMVSMKLRKPHTTASLWSSGKITCTGATSEADAKTAARRICRMLQRMGYRVRFSNFRVVNVLGTCTFPFGIRITSFSSNHKEASYEPELHPGVTYKIKDPKATLKIFSTGSITVTAPSVTNVQLAVEHIYPLVSNYRMEKKSGQRVEMVNSKMHLMPANRSCPGPGRFRNQPRMRGWIDDDDDEDYSSEMETSEDDYSETSEDDY